MKTIFITLIILSSTFVHSKDLDYLSTFPISTDNSIPYTTYSFRGLNTQEAMRIIAFLAFPTNDFSYGSFEESGSYMYMKLNYTNGEYVHLRLHNTYSFISSLEVSRYSSDWYPFLTLTMSKELFDKYILELVEAEVIESFEDLLGKVYADFDGEDIAMLVLSFIAITAS